MRRITVSILMAQMAALCCGDADMRKVIVYNPFSGESVLTPESAPTSSASKPDPKPEKTEPKLKPPDHAGQLAGSGDVEGVAIQFDLKLEMERDGVDRRLVAPGEAFRQNDRLWIRVFTNVSGYVSVEEQTTGYPMRTVFPDTSIPSGANYVRAGETIEIPSASRPFIFDNRAGAICVVVKVSPGMSSLGSRVARSTDTGDKLQSAWFYRKGLILGPDQPPKSSFSDSTCSARLIQVP